MQGQSLETSCISITWCDSFAFLSGCPTYWTQTFLSSAIRAASGVYEISGYNALFNKHPLDFKSCSLLQDSEPIRLFEVRRPVNECILFLYSCGYRTDGWTEI